MAEARSRETHPPRAAEGLGARLYQALERLGRLRRPVDRDAVCCHGITHNQWNLLGLLGESADETPAMGALADQLGLTPSGLTRCAEPLVERGLLERRMRPGDRRVCCLKPTAKGIALRRRIARECARREERLLHGLPPEDRSLAVRLIERLAEAAEGEGALPPPARGREGERRRRTAP